MNLSWNKVSGATGYIVYRWDRTARKYYPINKTTKTSFKDKKLKPNVFYYYRVTAYVKKDGVTYESERTPYAKARTEKNDRDKIIAKARTKLNAQYRFGASGPNRFDCSGFVYWVYKYADISPKKKVKRSSCAGMYNSLKKYKVGSSLSYLNKKGKAGDIVFFKRYGRISHVGIYYKDGKMIHAANPRKDILIQKISNFQRGGAKVCAVVRLV